MKVSFPIMETGSNFSYLKGNKKALLEFLNNLVHAAAAAQKLATINFIFELPDDVTFRVDDGIDEKPAYWEQMAIDPDLDLDVIKAARRIVAAKVLGVPSV